MLSIPAGNLPSERGNKVARDIFLDREQLCDEMFKVEILTDSFLKLFKEMNLKIPLNYATSANELLKIYNLKVVAMDGKTFIFQDIAIKHCVKYRILKEIEIENDTEKLSFIANHQAESVESHSDEKVDILDNY